MSIAPIQTLFASTFNGERKGNLTDTKNGAGAFDTTVTHTSGQGTIDQTISYANGTSVTRDTTIVKNADGTYSETTTTTGSDGKTTTRQETITVNADGSETIAGTIKTANGTIENLTGTVNGHTSSYTLTNPAGKTETWTETDSFSAGVETLARTGTNFAGVNFSDTVTRTLLSQQEAS